MRWFSTKPRVAELDPAETKRRHDAKSAVVVDVREAYELREGHIEGARHIPLGQLKTHASELLAEPEVIFVCRSGNRSATATAALIRAGHQSVYNMAGGMIAWKHEGLPIVRQ